MISIGGIDVSWVQLLTLLIITGSLIVAILILLNARAARKDPKGVLKFDFDTKTRLGRLSEEFQAEWPEGLDEPAPPQIENDSFSGHTFSSDAYFEDLAEGLKRHQNGDNVSLEVRDVDGC